ncbi:MAG: hypothetical protein JWN95_268 [Frankiales bacterium]|nr:hypothetical protein [Frankiales bacterium]
MWFRNPQGRDTAFCVGFKDAVSADDTVARAMIAKRGEIRKFLLSRKRRKTIEHDFGRPIGFVRAKGAIDAMPGTRVVVKMEKDHESPIGFRIVKVFVRP